MKQKKLHVKRKLVFPLLLVDVDLHPLWDAIIKGMPACMPIDNREARDTNLVQWRWNDHTSSSFYPLSYEVLVPLQQTRRGIYAP